MRTRILALAAGAVTLLLGLALPAQAVSFTDAGPVDLSGSEHETGNVGDHVAVGSLDLGPGKWTISASVRLFVPDHGETKNSQGCGLYSDGTQLGGAGGSSDLWTPVDGGKEVTFDTFLVPPDWTDTPIVLDGPATVVLECFIDQSHGGAKLKQREGMVATDIDITALQVVTPGEPTVTDQTCDAPGKLTIPDVEGVSYLVDDQPVEPGTSDVPPGDYVVTATPDEGYVFAEQGWELTVNPSAEACPGPPGPEGPAGEDGKDGQVVTVDDDTTPAAASETLPKTGPVNTFTATLVGAGLLLGGGALLLTRRLQRRVTPRYAAGRH